MYHNILINVAEQMHWVARYAKLTQERNERNTRNHKAIYFGHIVSSPLNPSLSNVKRKYLRSAQF